MLEKGILSCRNSYILWPYHFYSFKLKAQDALADTDKTTNDFCNFKKLTTSSLWILEGKKTFLWNCKPELPLQQSSFHSPSVSAQSHGIYVVTNRELGHMVQKQSPVKPPHWQKYPHQQPDRLTQVQEFDIGVTTARYGGCSSLMFVDWKVIFLDFKANKEELIIQSLSLT